MSLYKYFTNYKLTNDQKKLIEKLDDFIRNENQCFIIKGYAGTGKTFILKGLIEYLKNLHIYTVLAAPTGRAAKVMNDYTKSNAYTIHKTIYSMNDIEKINESNYENDEILIYSYKIRCNEDPIYTIYIIDEASMISDTYNNVDFFRFGSGYLLSDLIAYMNLNNFNKRKVIFLGDNAQLPPINMNFSPALDEEYLKNKFNLKVDSYQLVEVIRQKEDSGILYNASYIRNALNENTFNQIDIKTDFNDLKSIKPDAILDTYLKVCNKPEDEDTIIITYSNAFSKEYNDLIRSYFFPNQKDLAPNDKVIVLHNNYNYPIDLLNGDFGKILYVSPKVEKRKITIKIKNEKGETKKKEIILSFRDVIIEFKNYNTPYELNCKIIENTLFSDRRDLSLDEIIALFIDFKIRNPKLDVRTDEFKYYLKNDPYFNALRLKFGYAITCHKAQGGEWKNVFVDCKTNMGCFNSHYFRWLYTALTRAKRNLFVINEPHYKFGDTLQQPENIDLTPREDIIIIHPEFIDFESYFDFPDNNEISRNIFYAIFKLTKNKGVSISNIENKLFHDIYHFNKKDIKSRIIIYYNKDGRISSIKNIENNSFSKELIDILKIIENKKIIIDEAKTEEKSIPEFTFTEKFLEDFFKFISSKLQANNIKIIDIKNYPYMQRYVFQKGAFTAEIDFYYNSKKQFTRTIPQKNKSTSTELLNEIFELIKR